MIAMFCSLSGQCQSSASRMMIGIGTPRSQRRIPRPMFISSLLDAFRQVPANASDG
jgi:hypothetical protein